MGAETGRRRHGDEGSTGAGSVPAGVFTLAEGRAAGLSHARLHGPRLVRAARGARRGPSSGWTGLDLASALARRDASLFVSHATAAQAWGLWLPPRLDPQEAHLARRRGGGFPRDPAVVPHVLRIPEGHLRRIPDPRGEWGVTDPAWTWTDLAGHGLSLEELVAAGDALLQRGDGPPRPSGVLGANPLCTREQIEQAVGRRRNVRGVRLLREALPLLREGVDSAPESLVRQRLVTAGWPEPEVNPPIQLAPGVVMRPDLAWVRWRVAVQYEGRHHFSRADQYRRDMRRDEALVSRDWAVLRVDADVLRPAGWAQFLGRLEEAAARRGWRR